MNNGGITRRLLGFAVVEITAASPALFLNECARQDISFWDVRVVDACTLRLCLRGGDLRRAETAARRCGCTLAILRRQGGRAALSRLRRQGYLCAGALAALLLLFVSSLYIWDIQVVENDSTVPDREILAVLEEIGVGCGRRWVGLSSDMIRNAALLRLPELSYLTVNVHGSQAEVLARGREPVPELRAEQSPASITAKTGGVITEMHVLEGEQLVAVGDTVMAGDVLVSAERGGRLVCAEAEITARTWRELTAAAPLQGSIAEPEGAARRRFAVIFGKRRVNFSFNSGIHGGTCDRITRVYPLALPGVFTLPVSFVCETSRELVSRSVEQDPARLEAELRETLRQTLRTELGDTGSIVSERFTVSQGDGLLYVTLRAECTERIDSETPYTP
ncbi:MAG: sporulation protein YqfD [Oscillospiraceae bacterium]|nr:sporulation protein YqfD [Oscillospiraceae bacterium]